MAYLVLLTVLVVWALFSLWGRPLKPYVRTFFLGGMLCICAEGMVGFILAAYVPRAQLLADPDRDMMLAALLIIAFIHPLMAVIYAHLASPGRQLWLLVASAVGLGLLEVYFHGHGYIVYRVWHPALTSLFYFGFLAAVWFVHTHRWAVPGYVHVLCMAFWLANATHYLLHGVLGLWQFPLVALGDPVLGSQYATNLYLAAVVIPVATLSSGILPVRWPRAVQVALGTLALVVGQTLMHATGGIIYVRWNFWLTVVFYGALLGAVAAYARWISPAQA